jgi:predicted AlkP superfamily pyrophosphatase or phosphodiesterase
MITDHITGFHKAYHDLLQNWVVQNDSFSNGGSWFSFFNKIITQQDYVSINGSLIKHLSV